jgi:hypothetical protein
MKENEIKKLKLKIYITLLIFYLVNLLKAYNNFEL